MKQVLQSLLLLTLAVLLLGCKRNKPVVSEDRGGDLISSATVLTTTEDRIGNEPVVKIPDPVFKSYLLGEVVYGISTYDPKEPVAGANKFYDTAYAATEQRIDGDADGEISLAEAERVVFLKVKELGIKSLEGLESFPNLEGLVVSGVDSPCLDLSGNTKLKHFDCRKSNLEALDLSRNSELKVLYCSGNRLSSLDLSKNGELTRLFCGNNQLATIDLSNNVALEYADCSSNQLSTLDVAGNAMLSSLYCDYNPLREIIVPAGHRFKHLSLPETTVITDR